MKRVLSIACIAITIIILSYCGFGGKKEQLTAQKTESYFEAYKELRTTAPEFIKLANGGKLDRQIEGIKDFEVILQKHDLSYPEFVKLNAKIGAIYSILNAESFMGNMTNMADSGNTQFDNGIHQMQEQIDNPDVPEETKKELRKSIEEMKAKKHEVNNNYEKNKYWADLVLDKTKSITNQFISKEDVELVKTYFDKITEAYAGGLVPKEFNVYED
jgi:hypothetical protein